MNVQTFIYNENFYKKLALTIAIIRLTPSHLTPKEYTIQLQNNLRRNQINESIQYEQVLLDIHSLRKSSSISIPTTSFDLLEYYGNFLQNIFTVSTEFDIEIQTIILETINRVFELIEENFLHIKQQKYEILFKQLINIILNYDIIPNIREHCVQHLQHFIDIVFIYIKQSNGTTAAQMMIEQIGSYQSYFLLIIERILTELLVSLDKSTTHPTYGVILINILQKLISSSDNTTLEQIINNELVLQQFHALLYTSLSLNNNDISFVISLWNIYGRIL